MHPIRSVAIGVRNINTKSGLGKIVLEQIQYYLKQGVAVDIYTHKYDENIKNTGVNIVKIFKVPFVNEYLQRLLFAKFAQHKISKKKYDLVIGHGDLMKQDVLFLHNLVERAYQYKYNKPMDPLNHLAKFRRHMLMSNAYRLLIANSKLMKDDLIQEFHIAEDKIKIIYPGYDPKQFNTDNAKSVKERMRQQLNVDASVVLIGFITSGDLKKRALSLFLEALHELETTVEYKVLLVAKDGNIGQYLQEAKDLGVDDKLILRDPIDNVEEYFHAVDFTVHPAYFEEFGMVVQEAMACGLGVITSKRVGASEIMLDQSVVMEKPNKAELTKYIKEMLENRERKESIAQYSRDSVKNTTWDHYMKKFNHEIEQL